MIDENDDNDWLNKLEPNWSRVDDEDVGKDGSDIEGDGVFIGWW